MATAAFALLYALILCYAIMAGTYIRKFERASAEIDQLKTALEAEQKHHYETGFADGRKTAFIGNQAYKAGYDNGRIDGRRIGRQEIIAILKNPTGN